MKVIITRPEEDAAALAAKLKAMGHMPMIMPLIKIVARPNVQIPEKHYQAICLTSANGVRSLKDISHLRNVRLIAVGQQTLLAAKAAGFSNGTAEGGDVDGLVTYVKKACVPTLGPILYISGSETSGDLEGKLSAAGFAVDRITTYDAVPAHLHGQENKILAADGVVLYSPRTAKIWRHSIEGINLDVAHLKHICLSQNVAAALPQSWIKMVAQSPTEHDLLAMLDSVAKAE